MRSGGCWRGQSERVLMITAAELRRFADSCQRMALATNNPKWLALADRWMHLSDLAESRSAAAETASASDPESGPSDGRRSSTEIELVA
jgi:hypothetical protein